MKTFIQFLLHLFAAFCILTFFSLVGIFYDLEMFDGLKDLDITSFDVNRVYHFLLAQLIFMYVGVAIASLISLFVLFRDKNRYWIAGFVFVVIGVGSHFKLQGLYLKMQFSRLVIGQFHGYYKIVIIDSIFLISLASICYFASHSLQKS